MKSDRNIEGQYGDTLFCHFSTTRLTLFLMQAKCFVLQRPEKNVISYRTGSEPSVCKGFSRYAFSEKAYRRYTFDAYDAGSNPIEHVASTRNMEV